jgi:hypothetical protein
MCFLVFQVSSFKDVYESKLHKPVHLYFPTEIHAAYYNDGRCLVGQRLRYLDEQLSVDNLSVTVVLLWYCDCERDSDFTDLNGTNFLSKHPRLAEQIDFKNSMSKGYTILSYVYIYVQYYTQFRVQHSMI